MVLRRPVGKKGWGSLWGEKFSISLAVLLVIICLPTNARSQEGESFQSLLQKAANAFQSGQYDLAASLFDSLEDLFAEEEEYTVDTLQKSLLPMRGYSLLRADRAGEAAAYFERFLGNYPEETEKRNFVRYHLAQAYEKTDETNKAIATYKQFEIDNKGRPEGALSALRRAHLLRFSGRASESIQLYNDIYASGSPLAVRRQARLRALQVALAAENLDLAGDILLNTPWKISTMPELAELAFAALHLGDQLLAGNRYAEATRCYRLVPPKVVLVNKQRERLREIRAALRKSARLAAEPGKSLWKEYYTGLAQQIEENLRTLQD